MRRCNLVFSMGNDGNTYVVGTTWEHVNSNIEYFSGNPTFRLLRIDDVGELPLLL